LKAKLFVKLIGKIWRSILTLLVLGLFAVKSVVQIFKTAKPTPVTSKYYIKICWKYAGLTFLVFNLFMLSVQHNFLFLYGKMPDLESLENPQLEIASEVYTADGLLVGKYFKENRSPTDFEKISPFVFKALLATEDIRFFDHSGIDPGATVSILISVAKGENRGGSTITQQLAKNLYKTRKKSGRIGLLGYIPGLKTGIAKLKEWMTAVQLERNFTKEEIMTMYLNTVDFGSNSFGIKTASKTFFNKKPIDLKIEEAAMLVGMLKATTSYNPKRRYNNAFKRRNTVINQMLKYDFITRNMYDSLIEKPIALNYQQEPHSDGVRDYYGRHLTRVLEKWADKHEHDIYTDGLKIYLTIDSRMQLYAREAVEEHMKALQKRFNAHWKGQNPWIDEKGNEITGFIENVAQRTETYKILKQRFNNNQDSIFRYLNVPKKMTVFTWKGPVDTVFSSLDSLRYYKKILHAGFTTMDPFTGHIKTWVGGINYDHFEYDHVEQSKRQPGSTFKAFVYATAIDKGYSPCYKMQDRYFKVKYKEFEKGDSVDKEWTPGNATGYFSGNMMTLRYALGRSVNSIAAQLTMMFGPKTIAEYAQKFGISSPLKPIPSIGLGSNDVSLFEMVGAYCTFVNEGNWNTPMMVSRIEDHGGNTLFRFRAKTQKVISQEAAFLMIHMLKGTLQEPGGTAQALFSYNIFRGNEMAGKTGTSSNQSDGWFIGLTKDLVSGVWVGAEERSIHFRTLRAGEGSKTALPIYGLFMEKVYADKSLGIREGFFPKPSVKITTKYYCPTFIPKKGTSQTESPPEPTEAELQL